MSWGSSGNSTQYTTVTNDARIRYADTDHAIGIWFYRIGNSVDGTAGAVWNQTIAPSGRTWLLVSDSDNAVTGANRVQFRYIDASSNDLNLTWNGPVSNATWYHVVLQRVGTTQYMYINGTEVVTASASSVTVADPGTDLTFARSEGTHGFWGYLADYFKFNRALTTDEITALAGGMRPTALRGAIDDLAAFIEMDSDEFVDHVNRLEITNTSMTVSTAIHPPIYDPAPKPTTYYVESTNKKAQFSGGPDLDVTKETPYGILAVNTDNISDAVNWAFKYQREANPSARSPAGGPEGAFTPYLPPCDKDDYWLSTGRWFIPNYRGIYLRGSRVHHSAGVTVGGNSGGCSRVRFNINDKSMPCILNQGGTVVFTDIAFVTTGAEELGILNHRMLHANDGTLSTRTADDEGVLTLDSSASGFGAIVGETVQVRWTGGVRYDMTIDAIASIGESTRRMFTVSGGSGDVLPAEDTDITMHDWCYEPDNSEGFGSGTTSTQPVTRLMMHRCDMDGFDVSIQNGAYKKESNCDHHSLTECHFGTMDVGWLNYNDQGVDIDFHLIEWRPNSGGSLFKFDAGGHMQASHILSAASGSKILSIGEGGENGGGPGKQNGHFKLRHIKTDTEALDGAWIVYMEGTGLDRWVHVVIDGGMNARRTGTAGNQADRFCRMVGRSILEINSFDYPGVVEIVTGTSSAYGNATFAPAIILNECQLLDGDAVAPATSLVSGGTPNVFHVYNSVQNRGATDGVARPLLVDDLPDKPTVAEMNIAINEANTYNPPAAGASGSIVWD